MRERKVVVAALARDEHGRILITRRGPTQSNAGRWELPGGKLEAGESPQEALRRELREEIGVEAEVGRIADVVFHAYPSFDLLMLVYACRLGSDPRCVEIDDWAYVRPRDALGYDLLPADRPLCERLAAEDA